MNKLKHILKALPEYYLLALALIYAYSPSLDISPIALILVAIFLLQLIFKNNISGIIIGVVFFLINFYMIFALIDEFSEFPAFDLKAKSLLFGGLAIIGINLYMAGLLISKNLPKEIVKLESARP